MPRVTVGGPSVHGPDAPGTSTIQRMRSASDAHAFNACSRLKPAFRSLETVNPPVDVINTSRHAAAARGIRARPRRAVRERGIDRAVVEAHRDDASLLDRIITMVRDADVDAIVVDDGRGVADLLMELGRTAGRPCQPRDDRRLPD